MSELPDNQWQLDKRVPVGLIGAIVLQTIVFASIGATWKAQTDARLERLEEKETLRSNQGDRLIILEQKLGFISDTVASIARKLDGLKDERAP